MRAIGSWQDANGLGFDGIAGPRTLTAMFGQDIRRGAEKGGNKGDDKEEESKPSTKPKKKKKDGDPGLKRPHGYSQIVDVFGEPGTNLTTISVRCGVGGKIQKITCNKKVADLFKAVFEDIWNAGKSDHIHSYDGTYVFRKKRGGTGYSTHSWGISMDINASANPMRSKKNMTISASQKVLAPFFEAKGFYWGAAFGDPMHFQYCTGY